MTLDDELRRIVEEESRRTKKPVGDANFSAGSASFAAGRYDAARDQFQVAVNWDPSSRNYTALGKAFHHLGDLESAAKALAKAVALDKSNREACQLLDRTTEQIHYRQFFSSHKAGRLVEAVYHLRTATRSEDYRLHNQFPHWFSYDRIASVQWDDVERFAGTLENLFIVYRCLRSNDPQHYPYGYQRAYDFSTSKLWGIEFGLEHVHPFIREVFTSGTGIESANYLGIFVSAMINKVIREDETFDLDLRTCWPLEDTQYLNRWNGNGLGYKHARGMLNIESTLIKNDNDHITFPAELGSNMTGGSVQITTKYFIRTVQLGLDMSGGSLSFSGKRNDHCAIQIGLRMRDGRINTRIEQLGYPSDIRSSEVGLGMKGGEINVYAPNMKVIIGRGMKGGKIEYTGSAAISLLPSEVGAMMEGGTIIFNNSSGQIDCAREMKGGQITVHHTIDGRVGDNMTGGTVRLLGAGRVYNSGTTKGGEIYVGQDRVYPESIGARLMRIFTGK